MSLHFYAYARKGYEFIDEVARELKTNDTDKAGRLTRCVIRALRNKLNLEESFGLLAQLPMALKAIYVDGWRLAGIDENNKRKTDFISEVLKEDDNSAWRDFSNVEEANFAVISVFKVLSKHIILSEFDRMVMLLPSEMQLLFQDETNLT